MHYTQTDTPPTFAMDGNQMFATHALGQTQTTGGSRMAVWRARVSVDLRMALECHALGLVADHLWATLRKENAGRERHLQGQAIEGR